MLSCEFCETSKNTFFTDRLWATASQGSGINHQYKTFWFQRYRSIALNVFTKLKHFLKYSSLKGESWQEVWMTKWTMVRTNSEMDYGLEK